LNNSTNNSLNKSLNKNLHHTSRINRSLITYQIPHLDSFELTYNNNHIYNYNYNYNNYNNNNNIKSICSIKLPINNILNNSINLDNSPKRADSQITNRSNSSKSSAFKRKFSYGRKFSGRNKNNNNEFKNFTDRSINNNNNNNNYYKNSFNKKNLLNSDNFEKYEINNIIPVNETEIKKIFNSNGINIYNLKDTKHDLITGKYSLQFNINKNENDKNYETKLDRIKKKLNFKKLENKFEKKETITNKKNFYGDLINDYKNKKNDYEYYENYNINNKFTNTFGINHKYKNFINYQTHGN
jgi:hypothetical protein